MTTVESHRRLAFTSSFLHPAMRTIRRGSRTCRRYTRHRECTARFVSISDETVGVRCMLINAEPSPQTVLHVCAMCCDNASRDVFGQPFAAVASSRNDDVEPSVMSCICQRFCCVSRRPASQPPLLKLTRVGAATPRLHPRPLAEPSGRMDISTNELVVLTIVLLSTTVLFYANGTRRAPLPPGPPGVPLLENLFQFNVMRPYPQVWYFRSI